MQRVRLGGTARKLALALAAVAVMAALALVGVVLGNRSLPGPLEDTEHLEALDKARLEEANRLRLAYGDGAWPGWGDAPIPVRMSNGLWDFLVDHPAPPEDWVRVSDDSVAGRPYYRKLAVATAAEGGVAAAESDIQRLRVGGVPVAGIVTKRAMDTFLIHQLEERAPRIVAPFLPYWRLVQPSETYVASIVNASLQAHFDARAPERMAEARLAFENISGYPFGLSAQVEGWPVEIEALIRAVEEPSEAEALSAAGEFLVARGARRQAAQLDPWSIHLERQTEWSKGLAMYGELLVWRAASANEADTPTRELAGDPHFRGYGGYADHWAQVLSVIRSCSRRPCAMRFQYTGMLQAFALDRHLPGWQVRATGPDVFLEDLVREAAAGSGR